MTDDHGKNDILSARVEPKRVASLLESAVRDIGIPSRPMILDRINAEMHRDEPDFHHLARLIASDVALGAGLISIANSPYFGFRGRARSINEALMMLGLDVAGRAIAGLILRRLFPMTPAMERFWNASAAIARLSGWVAQKVDTGHRVRSDDAYTFGLFRDCGIAILLNRFPQYPGVLKQANDEPEMSFTAVEEKECPTNHAVVGSMLAQSWWLPEEISVAIRHHHDYSALQQSLDDGVNLTGASRSLIATAQFAEYLLQRQTGMSQTREWEKAGAICLDLLGFDDKDLSTLYEECAVVIASGD